MSILHGVAFETEDENTKEESKLFQIDIYTCIDIANGGGAGGHMPPQNARRGALPPQIFAILVATPWSAT